MEILEIYNDLVLLKKHEQDKVSKGGIIIPDVVNSLPKIKATVIKHGPGYIDEQTGEFFAATVKDGDTVGLSSYLCHEDNEFVIDGVKYYLVRERDLDVKFIGDEGFIGIMPAIRKFEEENNIQFNIYR